MNMLFSILGQEAVVIAVMCLVFWCIDKKFGYRIAFSFFLSGVTVQILKIIFKVPRPWILSKSIIPSESAKAGATGYSFPSAHTQSATSLYGTLAYNIKKRAFQLLMLIIILLVAFSRLYLGVHTPLDVSVALVITFMITVGVNYAIDSGLVYKYTREQILAVLLIIPMLMVVVAVIQLKFFFADSENLMDLVKSAGAALGFSLGWYFESKYVEFDASKGSVVEKIIRVVAGVVILLLIRKLLKPVESTLVYFGFVRYFVMLFVGIYLYPMIFDKITKGNEKN
ncbi:MAG: phosphatase PAP2 family protein [Lachnospiraceae bacterium]|nr:phosphatase PAP2 family protein [Lachnospiraceae bacterium]